MNPQKIARVTGVLFLITIVLSIPAQFVLYGPVLNNAAYVVGAGALVQWGAFLEVITALACIGTAVVLFPIVKRQNEAVALGYVAVRVLEAGIIVAGIVSLLAVETLRQEAAGAAGAEAASLLTAGRSLVAFHDATFLLGPGILAGLGNGILLGYLMYSSRLVPRHLAVLGLVGGPLVSASGIAMLLGLYGPVSIWAIIATVPEFCWELLLGIWLIVKGFDPSAAILSDPDKTDLKETGKKSLSIA